MTRERRSLSAPAALTELTDTDAGRLEAVTAEIRSWITAADLAPGLDAG